MSFINKIVAVTGGSKGIGRACIELFHQDGARVVILDIDEDEGANLSEKLGDRALFIKTDVSAEPDVISAVEKIKSHFGGIDVLVNNAAIQYFSTLADCSAEEWDRTLSVNLRGNFLCAKYTIPLMQDQGGVIVNVSSVQAFVTQRQVAAYATSKAAQIALTRSIAIDYAPAIRCVAVCPGSVDTPLLRDLVSQSPDPAAVLKECEDMHLVKRIANASEIAGFIAYLAGDKAAFITGQAFRIDGGLGITIEGSKR